MHHTLSRPLTAAALLAAVPLSGALAADYVFTGATTYSVAPLVFEDDGLALTVSADTGLLYRDPWIGLGNFGAAAGVMVGAGESLSFDFGGTTVALLGATFEGVVGAATGVRIYGDGALLGDLAFNHGAGGTTLDLADREWTAGSFAFEGLAGSAAGFGVSGVAVATPQPTGLAGPVPLPPAAWLLASALALVGVVGRGRYRKSREA